MGLHRELAAAPGPHFDAASRKDLAQLRLDFLLMMLFRGNDYLPALVRLGLLCTDVQVSVSTAQLFESQRISLSEFLVCLLHDCTHACICTHMDSEPR